MKKLLIFILSTGLAACDTSSIGLDNAAPGTAPAAPSVSSGPALSVDPAALAASLACTGDLASRTPVLLVHGTAVSVGEFSWNYVPALTALGIPLCTVQLPFNALGDIQEAAEYVVYAIREMNRISGRKIQIIGHSQGGMLPRWSLRFWPDTRAMVDDLVGLAASNHGTVVALPFCPPGRGCAPSIWQQQLGSDFITALNADFETFDSISYTSVYSVLDEIVVPNLPLTGATSSTSLAGGDNVVNLATQEICPNNTAEHLSTGTFDAAAFAATLDALSNDGPADVLRIPLTVCLEPLMPGVNPATFPTDAAQSFAEIPQSIATGPVVAEEPPLRCYVDNSC